MSTEENPGDAEAAATPSRTCSAAEIVVAAGALFNLGWMIFGYPAFRRDRRSWRRRQSLIAIG